MKLIRRFIVCFVLLGGFFIGVKNVGAAGISDIMTKKTYYTGVMDCFTAGFRTGGMIDGIEIKDFNGIESLTNKNRSIVKEIGEHGEGKGEVTCADLLSKQVENKIPSTVSTGDPGEKATVLKNSGYKLDSASNNEMHCYAFRIASVNSLDSTDLPLKIIEELCVKKTESGGFETKFKDNSGNTNVVFYDAVGERVIKLNVAKKRPNNVSWFAYAEVKIEDAKNESEVFSRVGNVIADSIGSAKASQNVIEFGKERYYAACAHYEPIESNGGIRCTKTETGLEASSFDFIFSESEASVTDKYKKITEENELIRLFSNYKDGGSDGAEKHGFATKADLKFDDDEQYSLYYYYLKNTYGMTDLKCSNTDGDSGGRMYTTKLWWDEENKYSDYCSFNISGDSKVWVHGVFTESRLFGLEIKGIDDLIALMKGLNPTKKPDVFDGPTELEGTDSVTIEENCRNSAGTEGLGWIICPLLTSMGGSATELYENYVAPSLAVDATLFGEEANDNIFITWETFRDMANILFIILLLIVVFSQLTGVGIDNYGIKKILPRLIVSAILINLSYFICILLVDISNIAGNGFQALFDNLGAGLNPMVTVAGAKGVTPQEGVEIVSGIASVGVLGVLVGGTGLAIWGGMATVLSLFVSALGVVVSIFFLFILLSARGAAVIVLIAISPLAVIAYVLPNMKKYYDKWTHAFGAMLLIYPTTGLLVGGGNYVSRLLLNNGTDNFFQLITAMVVGILPVFFVPSVMKDAFSAIGRIGGAISGLGDKARSGMTKMAGNSELAKGVRQGTLERQTRMKAGLDRDGNSTAFRRGLGNVLSLGSTGRRRSALTYQKMLSDRGSLEATEGADFMLRTQAANETRRLEASGDINTIGRMNGRNDGSGLTGGLYNALVNNDRARILAYTDALSAKGEAGHDAVKSAYNNAALSGRMTEQSAQTFAANIMSKHAANYKNDDRSMYEIANAINSQKPFRTDNRFATTDEYVNGNKVRLMTSAKAETMASMDDAAFAEAFLKNGIYSDEGGLRLEDVSLEGVNDQQRVAIGKNAYSALKNTTNMNANRIAYLSKILEKSRYKPDDVQKVQIVSNNPQNGNSNP